MDEAIKVKEYLKIDEIYCLNLECQKVNGNDQNLFHQLIKYIRRLKPELVITHLKNDKHKDHRNTNLAVVEACWKAQENLLIELGECHKVKDIWGMEVLDIENIDYVLDITNELNYKINAMNIYNSQLKLMNNINSHITGLAMVRGYQIGCKYGEGFKRISTMPLMIN